MAKPSFTTAQAAARIAREDFSWGSSVTYGFRSSVPSGYRQDPTSKEKDSFSRFTAAEIAVTREVLALYEDVAKISFVAAGGASYTNSATMLFANYRSTTDNSGAFASGPSRHGGNKAVSSIDGDVWYNLANSPGAITRGNGNYQTFIHEIGHAIGLSHPGNYNAAPGFTPTYARHAAYKEDTLQYSVMSYFAASNTGADHVHGGVTYYASTLLLHDIAAIQKLYGSASARTGNTKYGFSSNADLKAYKIDTPSEQVVYCVWDSGGQDTFDFSKYTGFDQEIDLRPGHFSDIGALTKNVSIAVGTWIENAIGAEEDDVIIGNKLANKLTGGDGKDTLCGDNSYKDFRAASLDLVGVASGWSATLQAQLNKALKAEGGLLAGRALVPGSADTLTGGKGSDWLIGGGGNDTLIGDPLTTINSDDSDVLSGGDGVDELVGGDGNDWLVGGRGADTMLGADGNDVYFAESAADKIIEGADGGFDRVIMTERFVFDHKQIEQVIFAKPLETRIVRNDLDIVDLSRGNDKVTITINDTDHETFFRISSGGGADRIILDAADADEFVLDMRFYLSGFTADDRIDIRSTINHVGTPIAGKVTADKTIRFGGEEYLVAPGITITHEDANGKKTPYTNGNHWSIFEYGRTVSVWGAFFHGDGLTADNFII